MQFRDKTACVWGLRYQWDPLLLRNPVPRFLHFMPPCSLEIERLEDKPTKSGKTNGLLLLVDTNTNQENSLVPKKGGQNAEDTKAADQFKVFIHTFGQYTTFGSGSFEMSVLKKLTGTESFEQLPDNKKKCQVHKRVECQTAKYLDQVQAECRCVPWSLNSNSPVQVKAGSSIFD